MVNLFQKTILLTRRDTTEASFINWLRVNLMRRTGRVPNSMCDYHDTQRLQRAYFDNFRFYQMAGKGIDTIHGRRATPRENATTMIFVLVSHFVPRSQTTPDHSVLTYRTLQATVILVIAIPTAFRKLYKDRPKRQYPPLWLMISAWVLRYVFASLELGDDARHRTWATESFFEIIDYVIFVPLFWMLMAVQWSGYVPPPPPFISFPEGHSPSSTQAD